jgi:hypothetical protein
MLNIKINKKNMKIVRKFNDFVSKRKINENGISDVNINDMTDANNNVDDNTVEELDDVDDRFIDDEVEVDDSVGEEEENDLYIGTKLMNMVADKLKTDVVNNEINYNNKKINFYSEDEKFQISYTDDKKGTIKTKFPKARGEKATELTVDEVIDFVKGA